MEKSRVVEGEMVSGGSGWERARGWEGSGERERRWG